MQALILAAGLGTRMRPILPDSPKVMIDVNGKPFLLYLIEHLRRNGVNDLVIAVGFLAEKIRVYFGNGTDFGVRIKYSESHLPMGTAGEIRLALPYLKDNFFVINGDTYLDEDYRKILEVHKQKKASATMVITKQPKGTQGGLVRLYKNGFVRKVEDGVSKDGKAWVNSGLYLIEKKLAKRIPLQKKVFLEYEILPDYFRKRGVFGYQSERKYLEVGTPKSYREVMGYFKRAKR